MASAADPYAEIAAVYDAEFAGAAADIRTYANDLAGRRRILVLGCGSGRVSEGLWAADREVIGVDRSAPMVARARRGRCQYVVGDMTCPPDLGRFDAVVIPNGSFSFLPDRRAQVACLSAVRALVNGPLWIDVPMPDFSLLGQPHTPQAPAWEGLVDGQAVSRTREVFRDVAEQRLVLRDRYWRVGRLIAESDLHLRLIFPAELEWMLEAAGFYADVLYGDHALGKVRPGCPRLLVRAL